MSETRDRLLRAAAEIVAERGLSSATARAIGERAGANQALVFYHFGTVNELIAAASDLAVGEAVDRYRSRFDTVTSLNELLGVGRDLHERERDVGNVALMGQLMANATRDVAFAGAAQRAMDAWISEIEVVVTRLLSTSPLVGVVEPHGLSCAVAASFIGMELYETVDAEAAACAQRSLVQLVALVDALNDLGPVATRALKSSRLMSGLTATSPRASRGAKGT